LKKGAEVMRETLGMTDLNPERTGANPSLGDNLSVGTEARQATIRRIAENKGRRRLMTILQTSW